MTTKAHEIIAAIAAEYGPGFSNGISGILAHDDLPDVFNREHWNAWTFRPAHPAFDRAVELGLITTVEGGWQFTPLGLEAAQIVQAQLVDESLP